MGPSVRVKRRHAYASIQDEDRFRPEHLHDDQLATGRQTLSETSVALSPSAASASLPAPAPHHDPAHLSPNHPTRRDMSRVNRLARRSSVSYRSFATDLDSNPSDSPQVTHGRLDSSQVRERLEGTPTNADVPAPQRGHPQRVSRVRSALSSSPSRSGRDSDDSDNSDDSEDEDRIMEDDEFHHDDGVVDHLDVIGPRPPFPYFLAPFLTLLFIDPQVATVATLTNTANAILL